MSCPLCAGQCVGADLEPLLTDELAWLWRQLADTADRRGDADLTEGTARVRAPQPPEQRAASVGLLGRQLRAGQVRQVTLADLTARVRVRGSGLTPGAVAAHAVGRALAVKAADAAARAASDAAVRRHLERIVAALPDHVAERIPTADVAWARLKDGRWLPRLAGDVEMTMDAAAGVLYRLPVPGTRADRRLLVPGAPHALDDGTPLAGLVLALAGRDGRRTRQAWRALGVECDDLVGGLLVLGLRPRGWTLPPAAVVTVPPRELQHVIWQPPPAAGAWAFVTENPSVLAAAADLVAAGNGPGAVYLVCTAGTPSDLETRAVAALADAGWQVAVRADFDAAGLAHVRALRAAGTAHPWRMSAADYLPLATSVGDPVTVSSVDTPWDAALGEAMAAVGVAVYEEDLLAELLADLCRGVPDADSPAV